MKAIRIVAATFACALLFGCAAKQPYNSGPVYIQPAPGELNLIVK